MKEINNICITINSLDSGGAEKQCLLLAKALKPFHNTLLIIFNPQPIYPPRLEVIEKEGLEHIYLCGKPLINIFQFTRILKKRKIDIIFSFLPTDTILSAICGKIAGVAYIFGGIRNSYISSFKYATLRFVHNYLSNYTISNNYSAYHAAIDYGFKNRVLVIPNGIDIRPLTQKEKFDHKTVTIISIGRLVKQKAFKIAIKSIALLKSMLADGYKLKYKIVGHGPQREEILNTIKNFGVYKEVELITTPSNTYGLLEAADIYLCSSTFEGFSNSIMEAMNCALAVVATDAGDNSRLVIHNKSGFITAINDHEKLAEHMHQLILSTDLRYKMGLEGYRYLIENYSYAVFQKKYLNIINNVEKIQIHNGEFGLGNERKIHKGINS